MKKFACLFAALSLACAFTACGGDDNDDSPSKAGKGEACSAEVSCDEGLKCDADSKKCVEDKGGDKKAAEGEDCKDDDACAEGLVCKDKKCAKKDDGGDKKAAEGEACEADDACADGLVCKDKKCAKKDDGGDKKAAEGEACEADDACADGLVCKDKKCAKKDDGGDKKAAEGEACEADDACADGLVCKDKKCAKKEDGGEKLDCAALPKTAEAYKALAAIDAPESADKCETWMGGFQKVGLAAHEEKIVSSDQVNEEDLAKLLAALKECGKTWMPSGDKFDAGYKVCVEDAADSEEN